MTRFSKIGFVLTTAGSAIGLGGIWKFPYLVGENGGAAFVLIFVLAFLIFGVSVFILEIVFGRYSRQNAISTFEMLAPQNAKFLRFGGLMIVSGILIFGFYAVVLGWLLHYLFLSIFGMPVTLDGTKNLWENFFANELFWQFLWHFIIVLLCALVLSKGVKKGIEKLNLILMPLLLFIFLGLLAYSATQSAFVDSFLFLFDFDFSKITAKVVVEAIGQAFFALSIGIGIILTYSNSLPRDGNFVRYAIYVALMNFLFCLLAGLVVFTFIFGYGAEPSSGPGLVFISLPLIFANMGVAGQVIAFFFFVALIFAGITSAISVLEPMNACLIERQKISRKKANLITICVAYLLGVVAILSNSADFGAYLSFFGRNLFSWLDYITATFMLPLGGVFLCIYGGWILPKTKIHAMCEGKLQGKAFEIWYFIIKYIAPLGIILAMISLV